MVKTPKVTDRRTLRFQSIDDICADAETIAKGEIRTTGNWSPAQIIHHVADFMHASLDGMDHIERLPWYMRLGGRLFKRRMLNGSMPPGFETPKQLGAFVPKRETELTDALSRLRAAGSRFRTERATAASPFLGPMSHEDWVKLHCRHAELHFSYMHPAR